MMRNNYARVSGIVVQTCAKHGTWVDHDDALRLIALFEDGGEARLREIAAAQEKEDASRALRRLEAAQASNAAELRKLEMKTRMHLLLDWFDFL